MRKLTQHGQQTIQNLAGRYGLSQDAVMAMLDAVSAGGGTMAQFNIPELGGGGQWMQGGMTMVGDMFNYGLKSTVDNLCAELSGLLAQQPFEAAPAPSSESLFVAGSQNSGNWWPAELGSPNSSGGQNNVRYAYFGDIRRLAVDVNGTVTVYDTLDHQIGGVSQQQGSNTSFTFTSQFGIVDVANLPVVRYENGVEVQQQQPQQPPEIQAPQEVQQPVQQQPQPEAQSQPRAETTENIIELLQGLAKLKELGVLTDSEFSAKKADLLSKI